MIAGYLHFLINIIFCVVRSCLVFPFFPFLSFPLLCLLVGWFGWSIKVSSLYLLLLLLLHRTDSEKNKINTGKRTEWSPIRSVIIRVITKSDDREAGIWFVNHENDYRPTSDDTKSTYHLIIKITIFEKHKKWKYFQEIQGTRSLTTLKIIS